MHASSTSLSTSTRLRLKIDYEVAACITWPAFILQLFSAEKCMLWHVPYGAAYDTADQTLSLWLQGGCDCADRWIDTRDDFPEVYSVDEQDPDTLTDELVVTYAADLMWSGLACDVLNKQTLKPKTVLFNASGSVNPGEMLALVGPSGAGDIPSLTSISRSSTSLSGLMQFV